MKAVGPTGLNSNPNGLFPVVCPILPVYKGRQVVISLLVIPVRIWDQVLVHIPAPRKECVGLLTPGRGFRGSFTPSSYNEVHILIFKNQAVFMLIGLELVIFIPK